MVEHWWEDGTKIGGPYLSLLVYHGGKSARKDVAKKYGRGVIKDIKPTSMLLSEVIQHFLDDTFLSEEFSVGEARAWKFILKVYTINVGYKINLDKSKVFFFNTLDIQ